MKLLLKTSDDYYETVKATLVTAFLIERLDRMDYSTTDEYTSALVDVVMGTKPTVFLFDQHIATRGTPIANSITFAESLGLNTEMVELQWEHTGTLKLEGLSVFGVNVDLVVFYVQDDPTDEGGEVVEWLKAE